jgi:hypothetical protein
MSDGKWVKLPKGAQVTMSRGEYEATQGIGLRDKVIIGAVIIGGIWLLGQANDDDKTADTPRPGPSATAPAKAGE